MQFYVSRERDDVVFVLENAVFYTDKQSFDEPMLRRSKLDKFEWEQILNEQYLGCGPYTIPGWAAQCALELMMDYVNGIKRSVNIY